MLQLIYAGAFLPKAGEPMKAFLRALKQVNETPGQKPLFQFNCLGTGSSPTDSHGFQVMPIARELGVEKWVREFPERRPYLEVLAALARADGIVVVGSTEPHYSPSKIFQALGAEKPLLALNQFYFVYGDIPQRTYRIFLRAANPKPVPSKQKLNMTATSILWKDEYPHT